MLFQLREMRRAYEPLVKTAEYTRESYVAVQRAFVSDVRLDMTLFKKEDGKSTWAPELTARNSGGTPTKGLKYVVHYVQWPDAWPADPAEAFDAEENVFRLTKGSMTVGPQATFELISPGITFTTWLSSDKHSVTVEQRGILVGAIRYHDRFSPTPHTTRFCFHVAVSTWGDIFHFPCEYWNCSESDCDHQEQAMEEDERKARENPPEWLPPGWKVTPRETEIPPDPADQKDRCCNDGNDGD
ncbi:hypothetical protein [Methyloligella solikamskensis]|uniref:Uncharacterized protein n=1 Tax=Methyloligella solikamskensis TaxID=1177756 RepID=A0ABW3J7Y6_9HYPH